MLPQLADDRLAIQHRLQVELFSGRRDWKHKSFQAEKFASRKNLSMTDQPPKCPICDKERTEKYRPFCSRRCADIDLNRWLTGQYAIPVEEEEPDDEMDLSDAPNLENPKLN